jgi:hypothetical protein
MNYIICIFCIFFTISTKIAFASSQSDTSVDIQEKSTQTHPHFPEKAFLSLPEELIVHTIDFLEAKDFLAIKLTCKKLLDLANVPSLLLPSSETLSFIRQFPQEALEKLLRSSVSSSWNKLNELLQTTRDGIRKDRENNWADYSNILKLGIKLHDIEFEKKYRTELESNCYHIQCAEVLLIQQEKYTTAADLRAPYWEMLAYEDELARKWLIRAYEEEGDRLIRTNMSRLAFWKVFKPSSVVQLSDTEKNRIFSASRLMREYPFNKIGENDPIDTLKFPLYPLEPLLSNN